MTLFPNYLLVSISVALLIAALVVAVVKWRGRMKWALVRRCGLAVIALVVALRPMVGSDTVTSYAVAVDVVLMVDRTTSMSAVDGAGGVTRLEAAKNDIEKIAATAQGARFSMVVFDNNARVALPFTSDGAALVSLADAIGWREDIYGLGTDISVGVASAQRLLERSMDERPNVRRYLVYIGDGEQTQNGEPGSFEALRPLIDGGLVLGYGTTSGASMLRMPGSQDKVTVNGSEAVSRIDEQNLKDIAEELGVEYLHRVDESAVPLEVEASARVPVEETYPYGMETYWAFACAAVLILMIELWDGLGRLKRIRGELS